MRESTHPRSDSAEQAVLGRLMLKPSTWHEASGLDPADFADDRHRLIFGTVAALARRGAPFDAVTVFAALDDAGQASRAGGAGYLAEIVDATAPGGSVAGYTGIVRGKARARRRTARVRRRAARRGS